MEYVSIGSGKIGTALARTFARKNIEVAITNSRGPETTASFLRKELGPSIVPQSLQEACQAKIMKIIVLAVPFSAHRDVAKQLKTWSGKIVVDATNAFHPEPEQVDGLLSSKLVSKTFAGLHLRKGLQSSACGTAWANPTLGGHRQVVFVSSDDMDASATVAAVATQLGFAPVELGRLDQGGIPLHVVGGQPSGLLFQNLETLG